MEKSVKKKIEKIAGEFIKKTSFDISCDIKDGENGVIALQFKTEDPDVLIGEAGQTLWEIQMILSRIIKKQIGMDTVIDLDINEYKQNKLRYLKEIAKEAADRVALMKREEILPAMPAFERRVVHTELALRSDVKTESIGEGYQRRVVIAPAD